ncbi:hypothetical protein [Ammoniphilus sp. YIM 78166]|uniref:hypothetical protein n=1 Tax=Ammoniphilus sp. YIM 78166 TaxID=1644106 RepID=UPI0010705418|nr:hypothetical protein [Ammoniphilus sp. YIM 78166]
MSEEYLDKRSIKRIEKWISKVKKRGYSTNNSDASLARRKLKLYYPFIDAGKNRIVYDISDDKVLKIAISVKGIEDNNQEAKIYKSVSSTLKRRLAKVYESGHGWVIMEKLDKKVPETKSYEKKVIKLHKKFKKKHIDPGDIVKERKRLKAKWKNVRLKKGKILVIDYGNFKID